jgi:LD-carboxypeptidase N-terminal domain
MAISIATDLDMGVCNMRPRIAAHVDRARAQPYHGSASLCLRIVQQAGTGECRLAENDKALVARSRMSTLIRPPRLKHGDLIGIAAPAAPLWPAVPAAVNASFERGLAMLRRLGFGVRIAPHALSPRAQPDVPAHERAEDLNALFGDPEVSHSSWQRYGGSPAAVRRSRIPAALDCQ